MTLHLSDEDILQKLCKLPTDLLREVLLTSTTIKGISLRPKLRNCLIVNYSELILKMSSLLFLMISKELQLFKNFQLIITRKITPRISSVRI